ncbi:MAG TPA: hypothetical protein VHA12_03510 [Candidatus Nanoarchaeia archaeon]|nr:hypothetical protein [Candidatus Nanoarchaeia archaeon]
MAVESDANMQNTTKRSEKLVYYLYLGVILLLLIVSFTLYSAFKSNSSSDIVNSSISETSNTNSSAIESENLNVISMKPTELIEEVISSCNSFSASNDVQSYCLNYRKVNFDGLEVFVNCDYNEIKSKLSSALSCADKTTAAKDVCAKYQLNSNEFVSVNGAVNTCAESSLK